MHSKAGRKRGPFTVMPAAIMTLWGFLGNLAQQSTYCIGAMSLFTCPARVLHPEVPPEP